MNDQCECMDGPNHVDPTCLYCGGTGVYASDERLAQLVERYTYLVDNSDGIGRGDFTASDRQHVAIFKALQIARTNEALIVAANISKAAPQEASEIARELLARVDKADDQALDALRALRKSGGNGIGALDLSRVDEAERAVAA